jgi:hypothetical protein
MAAYQDMNALMITGPSALNISRLAVPEARPGEIVVRTAFVGICGTDVHLHAGKSLYLEHGFLKPDPDCPSDAFETAASPTGSRVGWWQDAASPRCPGVAVAGGGTGESAGIAG